MWKDDLLKVVDSDFQKSLDIINQLYLFYEKEKNNRPYHINLIDELHANENAHTRILVKLLNYSNNGQLTILQSFLKMLSNWDSSTLIENPTIDDNKEYIDALIEEKGKYAVIVENKIHWAVDQNKQLESYVDRVREHGVPPNMIWVVYLTSDGNKKPDKNSYTEKVKKIVGDRYSPLNYRKDILPWLKEEILPSCMLKEEWLISALKQYVDHLEGMFHIREYDSLIDKKMEKKIKETLGISDKLSLPEVYNKIVEEENSMTTVLQIVAGIRSSIEKGVLDTFIAITKDYFEEKLSQRKMKYRDCTNNSYYQIFPEEWSSCVHLEWLPLDSRILIQDNKLTIVFHVESQNDPVIAQLVNDIRNDAKYKAKDFNWNVKENTTFYKQQLDLKEPFVMMSDEKKKETLYEIYDKMLWIIELVDRYRK